MNGRMIDQPVDQSRVNSSQNLDIVQEGKNKVVIVSGQQQIEESQSLKITSTVKVKIFSTRFYIINHGLIAQNNNFGIITPFFSFY